MFNPKLTRGCFRRAGHLGKVLFGNFLAVNMNIGPLKYWKTTGKNFACERSSSRIKPSDWFPIPVKEIRAREYFFQPPNFPGDLRYRTQVKAFLVFSLTSCGDKKTFSRMQISNSIWADERGEEAKGISCAFWRRFARWRAVNVENFSVTR